ncbi:hypothetical protein C9J03_13170 [Photobacterium gaetbulicola]|uniref:Uncharacterized protein n=2 Tax=Photobacterium gaetbulicola TaxID=1295392 RepID=A0A0C5WZ40_9GAMM|nr:hypothetical protein [Photobacterium gaetbulicola]AJR08270.1 hypothetical protein H744_2c1597 [Photobacterium gaetbulicola Gung47]KHT63354.1 hypothetical protein RJ45_13270 [Photobacterium gaetbulicola]PSU09053.1 hypothetical protein C9J03_13170 [Photobacterium gaetbulicola]
MFENKTVIIHFIILVLLFSAALLTAKEKILPTFRQHQGMWYGTIEDDLRFYVELNGNQMNLYGQDRQDHKFEVKYLSHYQKDVDNRIVIRQIAANADDLKLKNNLDHKTHIVSSVRFIAVENRLLASFYNGYELKVYQLKPVQ